MKYKHLAEVQRYAIKAYLESGMAQQFMAEKLGVSESTISRELSRNRLKQGGYNPKKAQEFTQIRKERFASNRRFIKRVKKFIDEKLIQEQ